MFDRAQLQALAAVLTGGSFEAAARALRVTPSAISQRIRALEEQAGAVLVLRNQPARPTAAGARLVRHSEDMALLEAGVAADLGLGATGRPRLKIAVNADSLATWFPAALASLPDFLFDLEIDDQDHSADWLRRGEVQAAVTGDATALPGCDCHPLGALRYVATASMAFRDRWFAAGLTAAALQAAPALEFNRKDRLQRDWAAGAVGAPVDLPCHRIGSTSVFIDAAERGIGWGMNPEVLARPSIAAGRLVALMPDMPLDVRLYWQVTRLPGDALSPLTRAVRAAAKGVLLPI